MPKTSPKVEAIEALQRLTDALIETYDGDIPEDTNASIWEDYHTVRDLLDHVATWCGFVDCPGLVEPIIQMKHGPQHPTCGVLQDYYALES